MRCVEFFLSSSDMFLLPGVAGTMAPGDGDTSNWNTSVHMPELSIGPTKRTKKFCSSIIVVLDYHKKNMLTMKKDAKTEHQLKQYPHRFFYIVSHTPGLCSI